MNEQTPKIPVSEIWKIEGWANEFDALLSALTLITDCVISDAETNEGTRALEGTVIALQKAKSELNQILDEIMSTNQTVKAS